MNYHGVETMQRRKIGEFIPETFAKIAEVAASTEANAEKLNLRRNGRMYVDLKTFAARLRQLRPVAVPAVVCELYAEWDQDPHPVFEPEIRSDFSIKFASALSVCENWLEGLCETEPGYAEVDTFCAEMYTAIEILDDDFLQEVH